MLQPDCTQLIDGKHTHAALRTSPTTHQPLAATSRSIGQGGIHDLDQFPIPDRQSSQTHGESIPHRPSLVEWAETQEKGPTSVKKNAEWLTSGAPYLPSWSGSPALLAPALFRVTLSCGTALPVAVCAGGWRRAACCGTSLAETGFIIRGRSALSGKSLINRTPDRRCQVTGSPEVSSTAFRAQPPDLPPVLLVELGFAIISPLAPYRRPRYPVLVHRLKLLIHASFRPRLTTTPLRFSSPSPPPGWAGNFSPPSCRTCSAHKKTPPANSREGP